MGCGISSSSLNYQNEVFVAEKKSYNKRQDNLLIATNDYIDDLLKKSQINEEGIGTISKEIITKGNVNLTEKELKKSVSEAMMQESYVNYIEEIDIIDSINKKFLDKNEKLIKNCRNAYRQDELISIIEGLFINFPSNQSKFLLNILPKTEFKNGSIVDAYYTTLKYNMTYNVDLLFLELDLLQLNDKNHCRELGNIVACNKNLKTLIIKFIGENDLKNTPGEPLSNSKIGKAEIPTYELKTSNLSKLFQACQQHKNLKCLMIINTNNYVKVQLTGEIENNINQMISDNNLNILILHNLIYSSNTISNLGNSISVSKSIKCLFITANQFTDKKILSNDKSFDVLIDKGIRRNNGINVVLIAGFKIGFEKIQNYYNLQKNMSRHIPFFEIFSDLPLIDI